MTFGGLLRKRAMLSVGITAALVAGGGVMGLKSWKDASDLASMCELIKTQRSTAGTVTRVTPGDRVVGVIGDSYSAGYGIPSMRDSWEDSLGRARGWSMRVAAVSSSGFVNPGACGDSAFKGRAAAVKAVDPDLLIVQGGLNDDSANPALVEAAAAALLDEFPAAERVLVGPNTVPGKKNLKAIDAALADAAAQTGTRYVSTLGWDLEYGPDGGHLSVRGHQQYADLLGASLR